MLKSSRCNHITLCCTHTVLQPHHAATTPCCKDIMLHTHCAATTSRCNHIMPQHHHAATAPSCTTLQLHPCRPPRDNPKTLNTQLNAALANRKLSRFKEFAALYPECCWVFLGDNGQVRLPPSPAPAVIYGLPCSTFCGHPPKPLTIHRLLPSTPCWLGQPPLPHLLLLCVAYLAQLSVATPTPPAQTPHLAPPNGQPSLPRLPHLTPSVIHS